MKTLKPFSYLPVLLFTVIVFTSSCKTNEIDSQQEQTSEEILAQINFPALSSVASDVAVQTAGTSTPVTFCNEKSVPLCEDRTNYGTLTIKRGSDNNIYASYATSQNWYLAYVSLYTGTVNNIPRRLADLPHRKVFELPFNQKNHQFVISGQPESFSTVGYVIIVKKNSYGIITDYKTIYADGCAGIVIPSNRNGGDNNRDMGRGSGNGCGDDNGHDDDDDRGNGKDKGHDNDCKDKDRNKDKNHECSSSANVDGKYFMYTGSACIPPAPPPAEEENVNICSRPVMSFFGMDPSHGMEVPWSEPTVQFAGKEYTEAEARLIGNCADANGIADSKFAFMQVATLRLSHTDYLLSQNLLNSVQLIENWLNGKPKLTPANLPTGNQGVKNAAIKIAQWIDQHNCPERR